MDVKSSYKAGDGCYRRDSVSKVSYPYFALRNFIFNSWNTKDIWIWKDIYDDQKRKLRGSEVYRDSIHSYYAGDLKLSKVNVKYSTKVCNYRDSYYDKGSRKANAKLLESELWEYEQMKYDDLC